MPEYDVAIIGAGPGGYVAAIRAAQLGLSAVVIERDQVGGLCLNWGCIPSKALLQGADLLNLFRRAPEFGIAYKELSADLGAAVDRSREIVARFVAGVETLLEQNRVALLRGTGRLDAPGHVVVAPASPAGRPGGEQVDARNVILASGGRARSLPGLPIDGDRVITSREALELRRPPGSIAIVGGGAVGVELAYLFRSYGSAVMVVELLPRLLPAEDEDVSRQLERSFAAQGISVRTSARVEAVAVGKDEATVSITSGDGEEELRAERVLVAVGIEANTDGLGLEEAGVALDGHGFVKVDAYCATNLPGVWAIGDLTGKLPLAHVASHQGVTAVEKIAGRDPPPLDYERMPRAVYCQPQVASLGLSEAQAKQRGFSVRSGRFPFRANGKAMAAGETEGFVKLVADADSGAILGFHAIGHGATELLGEVSLSVLLEATPAELAAAVHAHPTLAEALKEAALAVRGEAIHYFTPKDRAGARLAKR